MSGPNRVHDNRARHFSEGRAQSTSHTTIVIVGAGPTGLTLANFLVQHGGFQQAPLHIVLVEQLSRSDFLDFGKRHPSAHFLHARTMEIFRQLAWRAGTGGGGSGSTDTLADAVFHAQPSREEWGRYVYCSHLFGRAPEMYRSCEHFQDEASTTTHRDGNSDFGDLRVVWASHREQTDLPPAHLSQNHLCELLWCNLEASLLEQAKSHHRASGAEPSVHLQTHFGQRVSSVTSGASNEASNLNVTLTTESGMVLHADYVVACDGVRSSVRGSAGVEFHKESDMQDFLSIHFRSQWLGQGLLGSDLVSQRDTSGNIFAPPGMLYFLYPHNDLPSVLVAHDLGKSEFVLQYPIFPDVQDLRRFFDPSYGSISRIRGILDRMVFGGELPMQTESIESWLAGPTDGILDVKRWRMQCGHASTMVQSLQDSQHPCVFLAGDAAHAVTPGGGFGLNLGIQDAQNIWWKLSWLNQSRLLPLPSAATKDRNLIDDSNSSKSMTSLLLSYSMERSPHTRRIMEKSLAIFHASTAIAAAGFNFDMRAAALLRFVLRRLPLLLSMPLSCIFCSTLSGPMMKLAVPAATMAMAWQLTPAPESPLPSPWLKIVDRLFYPFLSVTFAQLVMRPSEERTRRASRYLSNDHHVVRLLYPELDLGFQYNQHAFLNRAWRLAPNIKVRLDRKDNTANEVSMPLNEECHLRDLALQFNVCLFNSCKSLQLHGPALIMLRKRASESPENAGYDVCTVSVSSGKLQETPAAPLGRIAVLPNSLKPRRLELDEAILRPDGLISFSSQAMQ